MSVLFVPDGLDGERVVPRMTGLSARARVVELIESGDVSLDGIVVQKPSQRVAGGQLLDADLSEPVRTARIVHVRSKGCASSSTTTPSWWWTNPPAWRRARRWAGTVRMCSAVWWELGTGSRRPGHPSVGDRAAP